MANNVVIPNAVAAEVIDPKENYPDKKEEPRHWFLSSVMNAMTDGLKQQGIVFEGDGESKIWESSSGTFIYSTLLQDYAFAKLISRARGEDFHADPDLKPTLVRELYNAVNGAIAKAAEKNASDEIRLPDAFKEIQIPQGFRHDNLAKQEQEIVRLYTPVAEYLLDTTDRAIDELAPRKRGMAARVVERREAPGGLPNH
jgi:hypothetical protein